MGNCCSDVAAGQSAIGGNRSFRANPADAAHDAVDAFFKSRGYQALFSQIEVLSTMLTSQLHMENSVIANFIWKSY